MLLNKLICKQEMSNPFALPEFDIKEIVTDSRKAGADSLFCCLRGSVFDGHMFAFGAYDNGCRHFLCDRDIVLPEDACIIRTPDSRATLAKVSLRFYGDPSKKLKVIGITGTKGKTTTALMIKHLMCECGINCGYIGSNGISYNNSSYKTSNTTPESLILQKTLADMAEAGVEAVALEVSSQALHTYRVSGVTFDTVVYTNLARDHIGPYEHPTYEHYIESKASLFKPDYRAKRCIYNADDSMADRVTGAFTGKKIGYSVRKEADVCAEHISYLKTGEGIGAMFDIRMGEKVFSAAISVPGEFNVQNALCAFTVCSQYIEDCERVANAMPTMQAEGRCEIIRTPEGVSFVIDYAHNGFSLACALSELRKFCEGKLICLFGSVGDRTKERRRELGEAAGEYADFCIVTSDNPGNEDPLLIINEISAYVNAKNCSLIKFVDRREAVEYAYNNSEKGDIVLLAGKGHETYQLIEGVKHPFSERKILESLIKEGKKQKI